MGHALAAYRASLDYDGRARRAEVPVAEARRFVQEALEKGERAARRSIELDSRHDGGHAALAAILSIRGEWPRRPIFSPRRLP